MDIANGLNRFYAGIFIREGDEIEVVKRAIDMGNSRNADNIVTVSINPAMIHRLATGSSRINKGFASPL